MKQNIESIKRDIELIYKTFDEQIEEKGSISGNAYFDETELAKLNSSKPKRDEIWKRIETEFEAEALKIACAIWDGFFYLADTGAIRKAAKLLRKAKANFEKYIEKQNHKLVDKDPYFKNFPIQIQILPHHLDNPNPPEGHRPQEGTPKLINNLSTLMKNTLPDDDAELSRLISAILEYFFAVPKAPRTVRKHL